MGRREEGYREGRKTVGFIGSFKVKWHLNLDLRITNTFARNVFSTTNFGDFNNLSLFQASINLQKSFGVPMQLTTMNCLTSFLESLQMYKWYVDFITTTILMSGSISFYLYILLISKVSKRQVKLIKPIADRAIEKFSLLGVLT